MPRRTFVNLPVKDLRRSLTFFGALGFELSTRFTDDNAAAMVIGDQAFAMLLTEDFFQGVTKTTVCDTRTAHEVVVGLSADSREEVDDLVRRAVAAGGAKVGQFADGPMYGCAFRDLDGHHWELLFVDPLALG